MLTEPALAFVDRLHRELNPERERLLALRDERRGQRPSFIRAPEDFTVAPAPADLQDRRVEITGPVERKMMINALNSGARVFMADFEDANSPTWENVQDGQQNVHDAVRRTITLDTGEKSYRLNDEIATLVIRPRGWHLVERHHQVDGAPISASLFDFGLVVFNNAREQLERGTRPVLLPAEARVAPRGAALGTRVRAWPSRSSVSRAGSIKCTVLIETILAAFEMDAILYELRDHSCALNAGRWDYIFSCIKKMGAVLPDRSQVTMTVPFMRAYSQLLVKTCHARGAHAIGGMAAFIPSRRDPEVNAVALAKVERGQAPRGRRRLRRHLGRASRPRARSRWPSSTPCSASGRTRSSAGATTSTRARTTCSTSTFPAARSPTKACASTSASACATSTPGCKVSAPPRSTT